MKVEETRLKGVFVIEPNFFGDHRGYFMEAFNLADFESKIGPIQFIQDNESKSKRGVLRGLHLQLPPYSQAKLVRVIEGVVLDVIVDLRKDSKTFGEHLTIELSDENRKQLFIPRGFAHGFVVLSETARFSYKVDNAYSPQSETGIRWNDHSLAIDWKIDAAEVILSEKDKQLLSFEEFKKQHAACEF
jgi:dTDP-4-dehydrorhamnose 3,5-epimerase